MYKIVSLWLFIALAFCSCADDESTRVRLLDRDLMVSFTTVDKETKTKQTTSPIEEGTIKNMYVLVFDELGMFVSRHRGIENGINKGDYIFRNITLSESGSKRTLHFIGNHDWSNFSDAAHLRKHENEVITKLYTTDEVSYWQRVELENGFETEAGGTLHLSQTVSLLRNIAQIAVINKTDENMLSKGFLSDVSFAICNNLDRGTVAPFDRINQVFSHVVTEPSSFVINSNIDDSDFIYAQNKESEPLIPLSIYERINSQAKQNTFVIVKGYYQKKGEIPNTNTPSYYKLDICQDQASILLDITRNICYQITLQKVGSEGCATLAQAIVGASNNNINASVASSEIQQISDGNIILTVDNTLLTFTKEGVDFNVKYSCYDIQTGKIDNRGVVISLEQDNNYPVVAGTINSNTLGIVTGTTASKLPINDIYQATITISKGTLSRRVSLRLRSPMSFGNVKTDPIDGLIDRKVGTPVSISFTLPADLEQEQFPIPVYFYSKKLSPNINNNGESNLIVDLTPEGDYRYTYLAPYKGLDSSNSPISHTLYLQTIFSDIDEVVRLDADLFNSKTIYFSNK